MKPILLMLILLPCLLFSASTKSVNYQSVIVEDMIFSWVFEADFVRIKVFAPTRGWVAFGYGAVENMKGANIFIGWVDQDKTVVEDHFGVSSFSHRADTELGGSNHVIESRGKETVQGTEIEFLIPVQTGDRFDLPLERGKTYRVILSYGRTDELKKHQRRYVRDIELN